MNIQLELDEWELSEILQLLLNHGGSDERTDKLSKKVWLASNKLDRRIAEMYSELANE